MIIYHTYTQWALYCGFIRLLFFNVLVSCYSAAVAYPLKRFEALCVQRCSTAYHCGHMCFCHLPISFDPSPLTFLPAELLLTGCLCFSHPSLQTLETVVCGNHRRSAVSELFKPPYLASTINPWSKSLWTCLPLSDICSEKKLNHLIMSAYFYAFIAATWLPDEIFALTS